MEVKKNKKTRFLYLFSTIAVLKHMSLKENKVQFRKNNAPRLFLLSSVARMFNSFLGKTKHTHGNACGGTKKVKRSCLTSSFQLGIKRETLRDEEKLRGRRAADDERL